MVQAASAAQSNALHTPVMLNECLDLLAPAISAPHAVLIDCTLGMGGHTEAALERFPDLTVIGIDRDADAIRLASERLAPFGRRFRAVHTTYDYVADVAKRYGRLGKADGVLMDLGVSSFQLDVRERGFSYAHGGPLDMRMDTSRAYSAKDLVNTAEESELVRILRVYGEEKCASRIAKAIVAQRAEAPIVTTDQLAALVKDAIPAPAKRTGGNPAKRTFQALRIAVNDELSILEDSLPRAIQCLHIGGRLCVEAYHSLEDRMVKRIFQAGSESSTPAGLPVELEGHEPYLAALVKGAAKATADECDRNPRAQSVRIRAVEKLRDAQLIDTSENARHNNEGVA